MTDDSRSSGRPPIENLTPILPDTDGQLAEFLARMTLIKSTGLIECVSGRHVHDMATFVWRDKAEGERGGYHTDISPCCSLCVEQRKAFLAQWVADPDVAKAAPQMLEALVILEWATGRCQSCPAAADQDKNEAHSRGLVLVETGHDIQCGVDTVLRQAGLATRAQRDDARARLGQPRIQRSAR